MIQRYFGGVGKGLDWQPYPYPDLNNPLMQAIGMELNFTGIWVLL